jgi:hypothetical protein
VKITGKIKPIYTDANFDHSFRLKVYFKEEGQWFYRKYERTLVNIWWHLMEDTDVTHADIVNKTLEYLSDEEGLIELAKDIVLSYYKNKEKNNIGNTKEKKIKQLIKELEGKEISFEMKIDQ